MSGAGRPPDPLPASGPPAGPPNPLGRLVPTRNPPALLGYYLGVFGLIPVLGLPLAVSAVVCGAKGLRRARATPGLPGRTHAWVAIVLGSLSFAAHVAAGLVAWASARG